MSYWESDVDITEAKIQWLEKQLAERTRERDEARAAGREVADEHLAGLRERDALRAEVERERMRLAACGVVANANTPATAAEARKMHDGYRSASCDDVARAVDREMELRAEVERLTSAIRWALGYDEGPPEFEPPENADKRRYWWRSELRRRAALTPAEVKHD